MLITSQNLEEPGLRAALEHGKAQLNAHLPFMMGQMRCDTTWLDGLA